MLPPRDLGRPQPNSAEKYDPMMPTETGASGEEGGPERGGKNHPYDIRHCILSLYNGRFGVFAFIGYDFGSR